LAAVLVAIAIPVFTTQLEKSREATDMANVRSAYAGVVTDWLTNASATSATVSAQQKVSNWQTSPQPYLEIMNGASTSHLTFNAVVNGNYTIAINSAGSVTVS
jgi:type IV pilus assembly protein PilA